MTWARNPVITAHPALVAMLRTVTRSLGITALAGAVTAPVREAVTFCRPDRPEGLQGKSFTSSIPPKARVWTRRFKEHFTRRDATATAAFPFGRWEPKA